MTLFGTADMSLGISVILRDQFTAGSQRVSQSMRTMDATARRMQENQMRMQRNFNAAGAMVGIGAINQMRKWISTGADFAYTMTYVDAIAEKNGTTFEELNQKAKKLGETTMFSAVEVASAMRFMAMAGMDTAEIFNNIDAATNLAGSTMSDLGGKGGAADILTNVMKGFKIESTESARVADILAKATSSANTNLFDMGEALKYAASTSKDLNVSLEESAAMVMMAGDAGIQGSMAGTAMENMMRYITVAAGGDKKKANESLGMLGLSAADLRDTKGNLLPIADLMNKIGQAGTQMELGGVNMQNIYMRLFGVRGKREGSLMLRNMADYEKFVALLRDGSAGTAPNIMDKMMGSMQGNIFKLTSAWDTFKISFTEALAPVLFPLLKIVTFLLQTVSAIMSTGFGKFLTILGVGFIIAKTASMAYRAVIATIRLLHMQVGTTMSASAAQTVAGYNSMTGAAARYNATARGGMMGGMMGGGMGGGYSRVGNSFRGPNGQFMSAGAYNTAKYGSGLKGKFMGSKFGGMMGRMKMPNMMGMGMGLGLGGMGLSMLGEKVGGNTGGALGALGKGASYGGTGMMVGSMFGPLGTAIGGIGGALWGLGSGLYDWLSSTDDNTDALEDNSDANRVMMDRWQNQAMTNPMSAENAYQIANGNWSALTSQYALTPGSLHDPFEREKSGLTFDNSNVENNSDMYRPGNGQPPQLNIYMDGEKKIQEMIDFEQNYNNIELGLY